MSPGIDNRKSRRFCMAVPVRVRSKHLRAPLEAVTRDISGGGLYFDLPQQLALGSRIECHLTLPAEAFGGQPVRLHCVGKVVRIEQPNEAGRIGIACTIEHYTFLKPTDAPSAER